MLLLASQAFTAQSLKLPGHKAVRLQPLQAKITVGPLLKGMQHHYAQFSSLGSFCLPMTKKALLTGILSQSRPFPRTELTSISASPSLSSFMQKEAQDACEPVNETALL